MRFLRFDVLYYPLKKGVKMVKSKIERIPSGIPGLDKLIEGGYEPGSIVLLNGAPGTGKTIACGQWADALIKMGEIPAFFCFEQSPEEIKKQLLQFGIDLSKVDFYSAKDMKYDTMLGKKPQNLPDLIKLILETSKKIKAKYIIIDSVSSIQIEDGLHARLVVKQLIDGLKKLGATTLLTSESVEGGKIDDLTPFLADAEIVLHYSSIGSKLFGNIEIRKMRFTAHARGIFDCIMDKNGLKVVSSKGKSVLMK